jgi:hypothetical protein
VSSWENQTDFSIYSFNLILKKNLIKYVIFYATLHDCVSVSQYKMFRSFEKFLKHFDTTNFVFLFFFFFC